MTRWIHLYEEWITERGAPKGGEDPAAAYLAMAEWIYRSKILKSKIPEAMRNACLFRLIPPYSSFLEWAGLGPRIRAGRRRSQRPELPPPSPTMTAE